MTGTRSRQERTVRMSTKRNGQFEMFILQRKSEKIVNKKKQKVGYGKQNHTPLSVAKTDKICYDIHNLCAGIGK